jgi:hypothetical protein
LAEVVSPEWKRRQREMLKVSM